MVETGKSQNRTLDDFYAYLDQTVSIYRELLGVMKEEFDAITREDTAEIDESLKKQQVLLYKTKGFDKDLTSFINELGLIPGNLSSLILQFPQDQQLKFYELLGRYEEVIKEVTYYRDKCEILLHTKLYNIDKQLADSNTANKIYKKDASELEARSKKSLDKTT